MPEHSDALMTMRQRSTKPLAGPSFLILLLPLGFATGCDPGGSSSPPTPLMPRIDVLPASEFNQFLPTSTVPIQVDILTDPASGQAVGFDALRVRVDSVRFGPGAAAPLAAEPLDVDEDGDLDLRVVFAAQAVALSPAIRSVAVSGSVDSGASFTASADVVPVTLDPNDGSYPSFTYYANTTDSRLVTASLPDGTAVDYEGERDAEGRPVSVRAVVFRRIDGTSEYLRLDAVGRPTAVVTGDGTALTFTWLEEERVIVTFRTPLVAGEARAVIDLPSAAMALAAPAATVPVRPRAPAPLGLGTVSPLPLVLGLHHEYGPGQVPVVVTRCGGVPVDDALRVEVVFSSGFSTEVRQAQLVGGGVYVASLPVGPGTFFTDLGEICGILEEVLGFGCDSGLFDTLGVLQGTICPLLSGAAIQVPPLAAAIQAACPAALTGLTLYCQTLGQGIPGGESLGDLLCARLTQSIDSALASDNLLSARAVLASSTGTGSSTFSSEIVADVPIPGPLPQLSIDVGSESALADAATSPPDPAPFEGYTFSVAARCVPPGGVTVVLRISGTDGYQDTVAVSLVEDGIASLIVPGAQEGVVDTLRATMLQYQGGQLLDQVTIGIVF